MALVCTNFDAFSGGLVLFDALVQTSTLSIAPFLVQYWRDTGAHDEAEPVAWLALSAAVFYGGRALGSFCTATRHKTAHLKQFLAMAFGTFFLVVTVGFVDGVGLFVFIRAGCGVLSGCLASYGASAWWRSFGFVAFCMGCVLGPFVAGVFYDPEDYVGGDSQVVHDFPAILSCACVSGIVLLVAVLMVSVAGSADGTVHCCDGWVAATTPNASRLPVSEHAALVTTPPAPQMYTDDSSNNSRNGHATTAAGALDEDRTPTPATTTTEGAGEGDGALPDITLLDADGNDPHAMPDTLPERYLRGCNGDEEEAWRRWQSTLDWREENNVATILRERQPKFFVIKECYPHYFHGRSRFGHAIYYERLGHIDLDRLRENGVTVDNLLRHYVFITEYIWKVLEQNFESGQLVTVLDVDNVGMRDLTGPSYEFLKGASKMIQEHYVERCRRMYIVNAPSWFSFVWRVVSPMLNDNTRAKIVILGTDTTELLELIAEDQLPQRYGGTDTRQLGQATEERDFVDYVHKLNAFHATAAARRRRRSNARGARTGSLQSPPGLAATAGHEGDDIVSASDTSEDAMLGGASDSGMGMTSDDDDIDSINGSGGSGGSGGGGGGGAGGFFRWGTSAIGSVVPRVGQFFARHVPIAHLGKENKYVFDEERGIWVLSDTGSDDGYEDLDEHEERLIRAIQAAHGQTGDEYDDDLNGDDDLDSPDDITDAREDEESGRGRGGAANDFGSPNAAGRPAGPVRGARSPTDPMAPSPVGGADSNSSAASKTPLLYTRVGPGKYGAFTLLTVSYAIWRGLLIAMLESSAIWLFALKSSGGLEMDAVSVGLMLALAACIAGVLHFAQGIWIGGLLQFPLAAQRPSVLLHLLGMIVAVSVPNLYKHTVSRDGAVVLALVGLVANMSSIFVCMQGCQLMSLVSPFRTNRLRLSFHISEVACASLCLLLLSYTLSHGATTDSNLASVVPFLIAVVVDVFLFFMTFCVPAEFTALNFRDAAIAIREG